MASTLMPVFVRLLPGFKIKSLAQCIASSSQYPSTPISHDVEHRFTNRVWLAVIRASSDGI